MVAQNIRLPNIRRMFVPDQGKIIVDADLAGADAQVVAWEADDRDLMNAFKAGLKVHIKNARDMWPQQTENMTDAEIKKTGDSGGFYYQIKRAVHGTNYYAKPGALVSALGWERKYAEEFQERWFFLHPKVKEWHRRFERHLYGTECWNCYNRDVSLGARCKECGSHLGRTVKNRFGFRRIFFDRVSEDMIAEALAWTPQSTVAFCVELGWMNVTRGYEFDLMIGHGPRKHCSWKNWIVDLDANSKWGRYIQFLLQVHDSAVFQLPEENEDKIDGVVKSMGVRVPYPDPLIIGMDYKYSRNSWGDC